MDDPRLPTRSGRFENRMRPARSYTEPRIAMLKEIHTEEQVLFLSTEQSCRTRQCPEWPFTRHRTWTWGHHWLHRLRIARLTHTSVHMSWLLSIPRTASAFGINPPFQATQTGPITDGFILHHRRLGRGHHYAHRGDQEHEGEQNTSTNWGLHPQTPVAWTTHAAPTVPHLAQGPMWPTHCGQTQQPQHQGVHVQRTNRTVDRGLDHTACTRERTTCSQELPPYGLRSPAQPEDATMQQLRTTVYVVHATTNETTQYEHVWSRRAQALLLQLLHRSRPDASSRTIRPTRPTGHRKAESLEPESTRLDHGRMRTPSIIRRSRLHPTDLVPCHSTRSSRTTRPCHHHPPLGHRDFAVDQATPHQGRRRPRGLTVLSPRMAAFGQTGMASQEGTGSAGTADTSVHNIQEPPRCPHRDSTEPIQEEGQNGPIGSPRIPCHPGRHGPLDPGALTTSAIGEGLSRLGEGQFHTDGYRPQQRPLGLPRAQGQHYPPSGLSGRRAAEPPPTLYLSEHRLQLCHQGLTLDQLGNTRQTGQIPLPQMPRRVSAMGSSRCQQSKQEVLPSSTMPCDQGHLSHTSRQRWLGTTARKSHHIHRYVLFVSDEVPNNQRPEVAQWLQTSSRPGGNSPQPITWSTSSTSRIHQHGADSCTDATIFPTACGQPRHPEPSPTSQCYADKTSRVEMGTSSQVHGSQHQGDDLPLSRLPIWVGLWAHQSPWTCWCTSADCADLLQGLPHPILAVVIQSPTHMSAKHRMRPVNMFE